MGDGKLELLFKLLRRMDVYDVEMEHGISGGKLDEGFLAPRWMRNDPGNQIPSNSRI